MHTQEAVKSEDSRIKGIELAHHVQSSSHVDSLSQILQAIDGLKFGNVNIIIQDGVVVQIDRTEKRRLKLQAKGSG